MFLLPQISIYFPFFFQRVTLGVLPFTFELLAPLKLLLKFFALCAYETILDVPTPEPCFPKWLFKLAEADNERRTNVIITWICGCPAANKQKNLFSIRINRARYKIPKCKTTSLLTYDCIAKSNSAWQYCLLSFDTSSETFFKKSYILKIYMSI